MCSRGAADLSLPSVRIAHLTQGLATPETEATANLVSLSAVSTLCCLLGHTRWHAAASHMTPAGPSLEGRHTLGVKSRVRLRCAYTGATGHNHLGACTQTPNWQHFVMVLLPLTSPLKRCSCPVSLLSPRPAAARRTEVRVEMCSCFSKLRRK